MHFQTLESSAYICVADSMGLSSFKFAQHSAFWLFKVVQGHPRSMILVPMESVFDFLLVLHCGYGPILQDLFLFLSISTKGAFQPFKVIQGR